MQLFILRSQLTLRKVDFRDMVNTAAQDKGYELNGLTGVD
jgi:hypothetical protein